jgi:hypothetical protein
VVRADCSALESGPRSAFFAPLWLGRENPSANGCLDLKPQLKADPANWSLWIQFYDDALVGRDQNWPMLHDIATSAAINSDAPTANINVAIEAVRIKLLIAATQMPK